MKRKEALKILIIDDEPHIRDSLAEFLEDWALPTGKAASAEAALAELKGGGYAVAIVDLRLPGMGGEAFIAEAGKLYPRLRFLIHTGSVAYDLSPEIAAMGVGPQDILIKPVTDMKIFIEAIRRLS